MVKNAWVRSPVGEDMLELTLSQKLYTILLCSRRWQPPLPPCAYLNHKSPLDCCDANIVWVCVPGCINLLRSKIPHGQHQRLSSNVQGHRANSHPCSMRARDIRVARPLPIFRFRRVLLHAPSSRCVDLYTPV